MNNICEYIMSQNYTLKEALQAIEVALQNYSNSKETRGELGELATLYTLFTIHQEFPNITRLYHSVLLEKPNSDWTTELDFVLVTPVAVFVVETKSFYGKTTILKNHKFQVKLNKQIYEYDPVYQNQGHCRTLYEYTYTFMKDASCIKPIVNIFSIGSFVDTRDKQARNAYPVLNVEYLYNYIYRPLNAYRSGQVKPTVNVEKVCEYIDKHNVQSKENMLSHIKRIQSIRK